MQEHDKARAYHCLKRRLFYFILIFDSGLLLVFQLSGLSVGLRDWAGGIAANIWLTNAVYMLVFCLGVFIFHLPFDYFRDFVWEHRFGLSNQSRTAWLWDELKRGLISLLFVILFIECLYFILRVFPDRWWLGVAGVWLFLSLFLARIMPNVIIPLFYNYKPVDNEKLREKILDLFGRCRVAVEDVFTIDYSAKTKKANAFVCGLGRKRRVVLTDNLLTGFDTPEIESVVAHELGHYVGKDVIRLIAVNTLVIMAAFYVTDLFLKQALIAMGELKIADIAAWPLLALSLMILGLVTGPLLNGYSRRLERRADRFSLELTGDADAFIRMMQKLGNINLAEFEPGRFDVFMFYDHPPIAQRIRFAENFRN